MAQRTDFISLMADADSLQLMLFACPDGVLATDRDERVVLYTGASEELFGFSPIEVLHRQAETLFADADGYRGVRARLEAEGSVTNVELLAARKDQPPFPAAISAALLRDRDGSRVGTVFYIRDHSDVREIEDTLRDRNRALNDMVGRLNFAATHDNLTGLMQRASAMEAAETAMLTAAVPSAHFGVVLLDLDHFKAVNDSYGHLVGDRVLTQVAVSLRNATRQGDIVGRFGGEEFIAFLPGATLGAAAAFAERVRLAVMEMRTPFSDGPGIRVTISAGVAAIPGCADNLLDAIRVADDRLLSAKRAGRNRVESSETSEGRTAA